MLWVNLVMDTFGALALGTELPTPALLERKPYKRSASLISRPMWRSILCQSAFQLTMMFVLMFEGPRLFGVHHGISCFHYSMLKKSSGTWSASSNKRISNHLPQEPVVTCSDFKDMCSGKGYSRECYEETHTAVSSVGNFNQSFDFYHLKDFEERCLKCEEKDYTHGTIVFNTFVWCQLFNEYNARMLGNELNMMAGIHKSYMFIGVSIFTGLLQVMLVEVGGDFSKTTGLNVVQWFVCIALGSLSLVVGFLMRFISVTEDPESFANGCASNVSTKQEK
jgi:magnesium-transporting ATPase (P-type)